MSEMRLKWDEETATAEPEEGVVLRAYCCGDRSDWDWSITFPSDRPVTHVSGYVQHDDPKAAERIARYRAEMYYWITSGFSRSCEEHGL